MHVDVQGPNNLDKIIDRVRNLQNLARKNENKGELEAALFAANKLIATFRLTQAQIEARAEKTIEVKMVKYCLTFSKKRLSYYETTLSALTRVYGGIFYMTHPEPRKVEYWVAAREEDFDIIEYLFVYISEEMERLSKKWCAGKGLAYALSWRNGVAAGISEQFTKILQDRKEALRIAQVNDASNTCAALVVLDNRCKNAGDWLKKQIGGMRTANQLGGSSSSAGYNDGRAIGRNMDLSGRATDYSSAGNGVTQDFKTPNKLSAKEE